MSVRFSNALVAEAIQPFWAALQAGEFLTDASALAGTHRHRGLAWLREAGGVRPRRGRDLKGRCLSFSEREEIALGRAGGETIRAIAARLGRSPGVSEELCRHERTGVSCLRTRTVGVVVSQALACDQRSPITSTAALMGQPERGSLRRVLPRHG